MKIYVAAVGSLRKKERGDETQFTTKIGGKTSFGVLVVSFCKISFPVTHLMPYYAETGDSRPLIAWLLLITLVNIVEEGGLSTCSSSKFSFILCERRDPT